MFQWHAFGLENSNISRVSRLVYLTLFQQHHLFPSHTAQTQTMASRRHAVVTRHRDKWQMQVLVWRHAATATRRDSAWLCFDRWKWLVLADKQMANNSNRGDHCDGDSVPLWCAANEHAELEQTRKHMSWAAHITCPFRSNLTAALIRSFKCIYTIIGTNLCIS